MRGEGEAMALKKSAEQAAGAGQGGTAERRTKDNSQSSRGQKAASVQSPSHARPLLSPCERQGTPSMGWVWLPIPGQWAAREMDSPGPAQFIGTPAGERRGTVHGSDLSFPYPEPLSLAGLRVTSGQECKGLA